jgi:hypothetical protein
MLSVRKYIIGLQIKYTDTFTVNILNKCVGNLIDIYLRTLTVLVTSSHNIELKKIIIIFVKQN